jgi:hypothetical protein
VSLDHATCRACSGYIIEGTLRRTGIALSSRCRCDDDANDRRMEAEARARAAEPLVDVEHLGPGRIAA